MGRADLAEVALRIGPVMGRRTRSGSDFGRRLVELRKARGLTQVELAEEIGSSQRAISYYENEAAFPPSDVLAALSGALKVSADELLGIEPVKATGLASSAEERRLWRKFQQVMELPERDQRAVIRLVNSLASNSPGR